MRRIGLLVGALALGFIAFSQPKELDNCNIVWDTQSRNSSESMPCGGGDIGLNVWVENGDILFYISRSGTFDENNGFLKLGRVRIKLSPNPFLGKHFKQELVLKDGFVNIEGADGKIAATAHVWVDVFNPVIHVEILGNQLLKAEATYESWRYIDQPLRKSEGFATSFKWMPMDSLKIRKDEISFQNNKVVFYHHNTGYTAFDYTVRQQSLDLVKDSLFNPLNNLIFGGCLIGDNMQPVEISSGKYIDTEYKGWKLQSTMASKRHNIDIFLCTTQGKPTEEWREELNRLIVSVQKNKNAKQQTQNWWHQFWERSFVFIAPDDKTNSQPWQVGRNYQLFRYMLGCNAYGSYPTKFNGGLFTCDPAFTDTSRRFTPDFRNWGGGTFTAQNQRLVYFPMIKNGDFDLMKPQFDFYLRIQKTAELRSKIYWGHKGACFSEQLENFGLPNCAEYGSKRPAYFDKGLEYNAWLEYEWDTALEFCLMMLEKQSYTGIDINEYLPFIQSCLTFFDEHYQYLARQRGRKALDDAGHLVLYPGSAGETYKMAYNSSSTIAALQTITRRMLELPTSYLTDSIRSALLAFQKRIPPLNYRQINGMTTISPALHWERVNNTETMQLYPVFPWRIFGVGKPGLDTARNTWGNDLDAIKFRADYGWKQDNIWAACLGLTKEAADLNTKKMSDSSRRFPAFWGPGFDWVPDHNHGGSGMIGIQEMLLQCDGNKIYLFPAWPANWNVHFKLHAPQNTTVEVILNEGKIQQLKVIPESRLKDIVTEFPYSNK
jgi:hypothetical protein